MIGAASDSNNIFFMPNLIFLKVLIWREKRFSSSALPHEPSPGTWGQDIASGMG